MSSKLVIVWSRARLDTEASHGGDRSSHRSRSTISLSTQTGADADVNETTKMEAGARRPLYEPAASQRVQPCPRRWPTEIQAAFLPRHIREHTYGPCGR